MRVAALGDEGGAEGEALAHVPLQALREVGAPVEGTVHGHEALAENVHETATISCDAATQSGPTIRDVAYCL